MSMDRMELAKDAVGAAEAAGAEYADARLVRLNEEELSALIDDHYLGESQTLTTQAEQNLLRLKELRGNITPEELARLEAIRTRSTGGGYGPTQVALRPARSTASPRRASPSRMATCPAVCAAPRWPR